MSASGGAYLSEIFTAPKQAEINSLVKELLQEGLLNDQFQLVQAIRVVGDLQIVAKMIHLYCTEIEKDLEAFSNYLTKSNIDYARVAVRAGHLGLRSCSIGAQSIQLACPLFMQACVHRSKEQCVDVLYRLYREYFHLRTKFMAVLQLEVQIFCLRQQRSILHVRQPSV